MAVKLRKPILVTGIALSTGIWLWESFLHSVVKWGELSLVGAIALGTVFWWWQKKASPQLLPLQSSLPIDRETVDKAIASAQATIALLETEATDKDISSLKQEIDQLPEALNRQELQIAVTGGKKVGKTSLRELIEQKNIGENISLLETEALYSEIEDKEAAATKISLASDLVLFLTNGDLTDSEWQTISRLQESNQRTILIFNKQDRYIPEERAFILQQLRQRVEEIVPSEDLVAISAAPNSVKVRKYQEDGSVEERIEQPLPEVDILSDRLKQILQQERQQLVWATTYRQTIDLKTTAKTALNEIRRDRALPVVEQYQWIAAAAAFANPVAVMDLLATVAINAQMLVDLSEIYEQKFSLSQAQTTSGTIGKLMVKLGLVEISTQTIGSILKSNAFTYVAGGGLQGVSAAYLTRIAGLSLIEYFQEQENNAASGEGLNLEAIGQKLQKIFQQNQRTVIIQSFVKQAMARLSLESAQPKTIASSSQLPS